MFGGHSIFFAKTAFDPELGKVILGRFYSYNSLVEFFNTGHCYSEGYIDLAGVVYMNSPVEIFMNLNTAQKYAYMILGRVVHLLTDLGVPAHAHADLHPCDLQDKDEYEMYMGNPDGCNGEPIDGTFPAQNWTATTAATQGGLLLINFEGMTDYEIIRYLFYTQQQIADHFPSGRIGAYWPGNNNLLNGTNNYLISRYSTLGSPPNYSFTTNEMNKIADESFNLSIRATATLYMWFISKTNLIPPPPNTYNVNFQNNFVSLGNIGNINVNGTLYTSPTNNFNVTQGVTITATAINQTLNNIDYTFSNWSTGSTNITETFYPNANTTYTANFIGKPNFSNRNLAFVGAPGNPRNPPKVQLSWNEHPNTNVTQYKIWRKVKHNGVMGDPSLIATVNRGTTTYTVPDNKRRICKCKGA